MTVIQTVLPALPGFSGYGIMIPNGGDSEMNLPCFWNALGGKFLSGIDGGVPYKNKEEAEGEALKIAVAYPEHMGKLRVVPYCVPYVDGIYEFVIASAEVPRQEKKSPQIEVLAMITSDLNVGGRISFVIHLEGKGLVVLASLAVALGYHEVVGQVKYDVRDFVGLKFSAKCKAEKSEEQPYMGKLHIESFLPKAEA